MKSFKLDYYAIGLHPRSFDILIDLIDLELGLADAPTSLYILGFILDGWTHREIADHMNVHHRSVQYHLHKARKILRNHQFNI